MQSCDWTIDGLRLAGLSWGAPGGTPVLALHGWMDHAGSFAELAPRLTGCHVVAPDLSGQGLSAHRADHASYNLWDDLPQLDGLLDRLGWRDCVVLGHSRGANIGALLAAALPARVRALISLDSLVPEPVEDGSAAQTLRGFVEQTRRQRARGQRVFADRGDYVARRVAQGNAANVAEALAGRALEPCAEGLRLRGDPRLFASSAMKLTLADVRGILRAIRCPVLNLWASDGLLARRPGMRALCDEATELVAQYQAQEIAGDHHFHLEPAAAAAIADAVRAFLGRTGPVPAG